MEEKLLDPCFKCGTLNEITNNQCTLCYSRISEPVNIRRCSLSDEVRSLQLRYESSLLEAKRRHSVNEVLALENHVQDNGRAVINTNIDFLWLWLLEKKESYESYRRQIINKKRSPASFEDDRIRSSMDSLLYGTNYDFVYAALSTDEKGLISYGEITVVLKNVAIEDRTTALERNSFNFFFDLQNIGWTINKRIPKGYICTWSNKHKLAVAKLSYSVTAGDIVSDFDYLVLHSSGDRKSDEFIELHIDGKIIAGCVEKVKLPIKFSQPISDFQRLKLKRLNKKYNVI